MEKHYNTTAKTVKQAWKQERARAKRITRHTGMKDSGEAMVVKKIKAEKLNNGKKAYMVTTKQSKYRQPAKKRK